MKNQSAENSRLLFGKKTILSVLAALCSLGLVVGFAGCACSQQPEEKKQEEKSDDKKDEPKEQFLAPDVVGMTKDDAERVIKADGFTVGEMKEEASETVAAGNVISQNPAANAEVEKAAAVNLVVSKGSDKPAEQVAVPDLNGMTQTQAEEALWNLKLVPKAEDPVYTPDVAAGKIFKQSVAAGTSVEVGTAVSYTAALGAETVAVPNVAGMPKDDAIKTLTDQAFNVDVVEEYNSSVAAGVVIAQNPSAKIMVAKGTTVAITVSKGAVPAGKVEVPNLSTMTLPQALQACNSAGLILDPKGDDLNGTVVSQNPEEGTMVEKGTKISATFEGVFL